MATTWLDPTTGERCRYVSRKESGIPEASDAPVGDWEREHGIGHHGVGRGNGLGLREICAIWRGYWRYHVRDKGWNDIGYSAGFADAPDVGGAVLEGRHWGRDGAHTQNGGNVVGYACCYVGDGREPIAGTAWIAWRAWLYDGIVNGALIDPPTVSGHDDWYDKLCPGPEIKNPLHEQSRLEMEEELTLSDEEQQWLSDFVAASKARGVSPNSLGFWHKLLLALRRQTTAHHSEIDAGDADTLGTTVAHGANSGHRLDEAAKSEGFSISDFVRRTIEKIRE